MKKENKKNIHLYFGEDDFTVLEKIRGKKREFEKKTDINIFEIDFEDQAISENEKLSKLQNGITLNSLFNSSKLLVIRNFAGSFKSKNAPIAMKIEKLLSRYFSNIQKEIDIFFIERGDVDKRTKFYKEIMKLEKNGTAEVVEFSIPAGLMFDNWIIKRVEKLGGKISRSAANFLSISLGTGLSQKEKNKKIKQAYNLWEANCEIEKLVNYCNGKEITRKEIELLIKSKMDMNIFGLIDMISLGDRKKAICRLNDQIENGAGEIYILTMIVYQFRNLLKVKSMLNEGVSVSEIAYLSGLHPFVAKKAVEQSKKFEIRDLKKIYEKMLGADSAVKTGKLDPKLALNLLVSSILFR